MSREAQFEDAFNMLCGKLIGEGIHRKVFVCKLMPHLVVKVEHDEASGYRSFANVMEWKFWEKCEHAPKLSQWLAPILYVSPGAWLIIQKRCDPLPARFILPEKLPMFLTDVKKSNFGLLDGRLVCHDYALTIDNPSLRPVKVHWTS